MTKLDISSIRLDGGTQSRAQLSDETIAVYTDAMMSGACFPPLTVFYDGSAYWLADGFHRARALVAAHIDHAECDVRQGSLRDAILFSVGANAIHGLPRTHADKRRSVDLLLSDDEWAAKSDRWIAKLCAVHNSFVNSQRAKFNEGHKPQLPSNGSWVDEPPKDSIGDQSPTGSPPPKRKGREAMNGKQYPAPKLRRPSPEEEEPVRKLRLVGEAATAAKSTSKSARVAERDEKIGALLASGLAPNEIVTEIGCKPIEVHAAKRRLGLLGGRVNPLKALTEYAVEFADAWQDAMASNERWAQATPIEINDLVNKLESLVFVTKTMIRSLKKRVPEKGKSDEHEPIHQVESQKD